MASRKHRKPPGTGPPSWRCRCGKRGYKTWAHARWDARNQRHHDNRRSREQPYWSPACRAYHVGSKPKKPRKDSR